jgi:AcrR family transcriptional regulator
MAVTARRERERIARREAILDAAQELIATEGYHGMRMDSVAEAAELSKGTLYLLDVLLPVIETGLQNTSTGLDAVLQLLQKYYDFTQDNPHHFRFAMEWLSAGERMDDSTEAFQIYRGRVGHMLSLVVTSLQQGQADGSIRTDIDPLPQAIQLWTSFLGVVMVGLNKEGSTRWYVHCRAEGLHDARHHSHPVGLDAGGRLQLQEGDRHPTTGGRAGRFHRGLRGTAADRR